MSNVERNWLFRVNAETTVAKNNVDALLQSIRDLKREAADLNFSVGTNAGASSGFAATVSGEKPRFSTQGGLFEPLNESAMQMQREGLAEIAALRQRITQLRGMFTPPQSGATSNLDAFGSGFDPAATARMNAAFNGSAGIQGNASTAGMMAAWRELMQQSGAQSSLGTGGNVFGTGPIAASGFPGYEPPPGQASFFNNQYEQGSLFGSAQNATMQGDANARLSQQVAELQAKTGTIAGNPPEGSEFGPKNIDDTSGSVDKLNSGFLKHIGYIAQSIILWQGLRTAMQAMQESVTLMSQFEATAARVAFVLDTDKAAASGLVSEVQKIGAGYGIAPSQNGDAAIRVSQATANTTDQFTLASNAAKLAMLSGENYGTATANLITIQEAFNLKISDTQQILDTVATIYRSTPASIQEITSLLERLGPIARATGMSMQDIGTLAARAAVESGSSVSSVANVFTRIQENLGTQSVQKSLFEKGVTVLDPSGNVRPFLQVLTEVRDRMKELQSEGRNTEALDIASAISGKRPEVLRTFLAMLDQVGQKMPAAASANDAVGKSVDTLDIKIKNLTASWQLFLEHAGNTSGIKGAADVLTSLVTGLDWMVQHGIGDTPALRAYQSSISGGMTGKDTNYGPSYGTGNLPAGPWALGFTPPSGGDGATAGGVIGLAGQPDGAKASDDAMQAYVGILNVTRMKELNKTAISQQEYVQILSLSVDRSNAEVALWKAKLEALGITGVAEEQAIQKLKDQIAGAAAEFNVNGTLKMATGAGAAYAGDVFGQMNQTSYMQLPIGSDNEELFMKLMASYEAKLNALGMNEEGKPTVVGIEGTPGSIGANQLQRLDKMIIFQQAAQMALQDIEKNTRPKNNGIYNFPTGEAPYVPYSAFALDRQTRLGMAVSEVGSLPSKDYTGGITGFAGPVTSFGGHVNIFGDGSKTFTQGVYALLSHIKQQDQGVNKNPRSTNYYGQSAEGDIYGQGIPKPANVSRDDMKSVNWQNTINVYVDGAIIQRIVEQKVVELFGGYVGGGTGGLTQ